MLGETSARGVVNEQRNNSQAESQHSSTGLRQRESIQDRGMCYYATLNRLSNLNLLLLAPASADQPALDYAGLARHIRRYVLCPSNHESVCTGRTNWNARAARSGNSRR